VRAAIGQVTFFPADEFSASKVSGARFRSRIERINPPPNAGSPLDHFSCGSTTAKAAAQRHVAQSRYAVARRITLACPASAVLREIGPDLRYARTMAYQAHRTSVASLTRRPVHGWTGLAAGVPHCARVNLDH